MKDSESVLEAGLSYAVKVVAAGHTPEQAADMCGIPLPQLQARLAALGPMPGVNAQLQGAMSVR
jgi:hypothetical protein